MRKISFLFVVVAFSAVFAFGQKVTQGSLYASGKDGVLGECPLKNTSVTADITGFTARVTVRQEFENNFSEPIEAVYNFPLSQTSAVDRMTMRIGERTITGRVMRREEARKVYEQAKSDGKAASLLDQQRPNIFTQSVANILPNSKIVIEISYVEILKYEDGQYEFVFPMTIGPRYTPGSMNKSEAQKISPPAVAEMRSGGDISIEVNLDAGLPTEAVYSTSHLIGVTNLSSNSAKIALREEKTIPNKDFILRYDVTGKKIGDALLAHRGDKGGFFNLILAPPDKLTKDNYTPKEIVFVLDTSGSMSGFPIEKAREAMLLSLDGLNARDTFNLITFAGETAVLFDAPVPATPENLAKARDFLESSRSGGGTEMMKAIRAALAPTESQTHLRVVCFMTDGYVGNEAEIIAEIQKYSKARVFAFGIGNAVNRFLLDKMAEEGRGEVEYVGLKDDGSAAARRFYERVRTPVLTDISIDWNGLPVEDVEPQKIRDLFSAKPLVISGRYSKGARGTIRLKGFVGGQLLVRDIPVDLPDSEPDHDVLATLWARRRVDALMSEFYRNARDQKAAGEIRERIAALGVEFGILTQFTSFVAVEEQIVNQNGKPTRVEVPVLSPDGLQSAPSAANNSVSGVYQNWIKNDVAYLISADEKAALTSGTATGSGAANVPVQENKAFNAMRVDAPQNAENGLLADKAELKPPAVAIDQSFGGAIGEILRRMGEHQKALKTLRADVAMEKYDAEAKQSEFTSGALISILQTSNPALRVDWTQPVEETLSIVGRNFVLYRPRLQTAVTGKTESSPNPELILLQKLNKDFIAANFAVRFVGEEKINNGATSVWHLELTPKDESKFKSVELWVDANGMTNSIKTTEQNGDWTRVWLSNLQKNTVVRMTDLTIALPAETKIIKN